MKIAYLDCFSGISGDMFLAALVDSGVPISVLQDAVSALGLDAHLELRRVNRSGIDSAKIDVLTSDDQPAEQAHTHAAAHSHSSIADHTHADGHHHEHTHDYEHSHTHPHEHSHGRSLSTIQQMIRSSGLVSPVQEIALRAFELLGNAESRIHNVPVDSIHFHEVGAIDAIADIVATAAGCHWLQIDRWFCSPLNVGGGDIHCAHGRFPVPAPATLELLRDLPVYSSGVQKELVTPTGAALLRALKAAPANFPAMRMLATGYGAGTRDIPGQPNVLRLVIGESAEPISLQGQNHGHSKLGIIETTIDDATPELLSYIADCLMAAGASDVYRTPVQMKKGRVGIQLTVLCSPARAQSLREIIFKESTTLGLRYREEDKFILSREIVPINTDYGPINMKVGRLADGKVVNFAPEYEDCRRAAEHHSEPLKLVMQAAMLAYLNHREDS